MITPWGWVHEQDNSKLVLVAYPSCTLVSAVLGCNDPAAFNYDPQATTDDGSCVYAGCTEPAALNYDPQASIEDGSCTVLDCVAGPYNITFTRNDNAVAPDGVDVISPSVAITRSSSNGLFNALNETQYSFGISPVGTLWKLGAYNPADDALNDGQYIDWRSHHGASSQNLPGQTSTMYIVAEDLYYNVVWNSWTCCDQGGGFSYTRTLVAYPSCNVIAAVPGCTNPAADNYDMSATLDDGTCIISGCTDEAFCNYDPTANIDDGSCTNICPGCLLEEAANFDPNATVDDGSCAIWDCAPTPYSVTFINIGGNSGNQEDSVTPSVTLARGTSQPLYNSVTETQYNFDVSPAGTLWKVGSYNPSDDALNDAAYVDLRAHQESNFQNITGTTSTMYVIAENLYYNVEWLIWGENGSGG
ncbi:MAG: hypothetical protein AAF193_09605, partial [Bacteroidota bacterium]